MKRATIADVAALAGVSKSTVSHALSGKRPISEITRQRIFQAINQLDYRPHPVAQRLAGSQTQIVGFVYPLYAPHVAALEMNFIASAAKIINQAGYAFLMLTHPQQSSGHLQQFLQSGLADGHILMQIQLQDPRIELLRRTNLPFVMIGRCADNTGLTYVDIDVDAAIRDCIDYLARLGHRSIAYLFQDEPNFGFTIRAQQSFNDACQSCNVTPVMQACQLSSNSGAAALNAVLNNHPETTAVIIWNDLAAWGVVQAAQARKLQIPQDLSFITFDYSTISKMIPFKPTAVDIRPVEAASLAAQMLLKQLAGESLSETQVLIKHELIINDSTAPPP